MEFTLALEFTFSSQLMYNALREEILKYLSDMSIKQVDLMRRYNINRNTLKKYISIIHRI